MYALTVSDPTQLTFELEWEKLDKQVALRAQIALEGKFTVTTGHSKFRVVEYKDNMSLYARVTVSDCTPIFNLVNDELKIAQL